MQWKFTLTTNAVYTGYTSYFVAKLKAISAACPYKTIYNVYTYLTNTIPIISPTYNQLIIFQLTLYLTNTVEIGGFRIKIQNRDENYNILTYNPIFLNIQNGGSYPCTRNAGNVKATSQIRCMIERDITQEFTIIHVFDLNAVQSTEVLRFVMKMPDNSIVPKMIIEVRGG